MNSNFKNLFIVPRWVIILFVLASLSAMIYLAFAPPFNTGPDPDADLFSKYGGFISGCIGTLLSVLSALLIYSTFQHQQAFFKRERFEQQLFEMIRSNRQIVSEMTYETPDDYIEGEKTDDKKKIPVSSYVHVTGQKIFVKFQLHYNQAMEEVKDILESAWKSNKMFFSNEIKKEEELLFTNYLEQEEFSIDLFKKATFSNIVYLMVFYGMGESGQPIITNSFSEIYNSELTEALVNRLKCKPVTWSSYWEKFEKESEKGFKTLKYNDFPDGEFTKYYGGHQHRLGHYFRQMFGLINFINDDIEISFTDKEKYVKMLRSQLSTYEQSVFFLNSLSLLGRIWELQAENNKSETMNLLNKRLLTKYNLVKNIPKGFIKSIEVRCFYPLVEFELSSIDKRKNALKNLYI